MTMAKSLRYTIFCYKENPGMFSVCYLLYDLSSPVHDILVVANTLKISISAIFLHTQNGFRL
jgi:hypothetical protein